MSKIEKSVESVTKLPDCRIRTKELSKDDLDTLLQGKEHELDDQSRVFISCPPVAIGKDILTRGSFFYMHSD